MSIENLFIRIVAFEHFLLAVTVSVALALLSIRSALSILGIVLNHTFPQAHQLVRAAYAHVLRSL